MSDIFANQDLKLNPPDIFEPSEMENHQTEFKSDLEKMAEDFDFNQAASPEFYEAVENEIDRLRGILK
jgi:protein tyrosine/serine phosphatase